jgi:hypothetical protein
MAFDAGDITAAEELREKVIQKGAAKWRLAGRSAGAFIFTFKTC